MSSRWETNSKGEKMFVVTCDECGRIHKFEITDDDWKRLPKVLEGERWGTVKKGGCREHYCFKHSNNNQQKGDFIGTHVLKKKYLLSKCCGASVILTYSALTGRGVALRCSRCEAGCIAISQEYIPKSTILNG